MEALVAEVNSSSYVQIVMRKIGFSCNAMIYCIFLICLISRNCGMSLLVQIHSPPAIINQEKAIQLKMLVLFGMILKTWGDSPHIYISWTLATVFV